MRPVLILALTLLLAACQMSGPDDSGLAVDEIAVTSLDAPADTAAPEAEATADPDAEQPAASAAAPAADGAADQPAVQAEAQAETPPDQPPEPEVTVEPVAPEAPKSPQQMLCEQAGGLWTVAGETGAFLCVSPTRDGGKSCKRKGDCEGECLARSGSCAPYAPLFGCNDVLDKDGRRMTLCLD